MALPALETLLYSVEDGIATITLHRPEKMNAFTRADARRVAGSVR